MATKSLLKTVNIQNNNFCRSFADAIERAVTMPKKDFEIEHKSTDLKGEHIKDFFDKM